MFGGAATMLIFLSRLLILESSILIFSLSWFCWVLIMEEAVGDSSSLYICSLIFLMPIYLDCIIFWVFKCTFWIWSDCFLFSICFSMVSLYLKVYASLLWAWVMFSSWDWVCLSWSDSRIDGLFQFTMYIVPDSTLPFSIPMISGCFRLWDTCFSKSASVTVAYVYGYFCPLTSVLDLNRFSLWFFDIDVLARFEW